MKKKALIIGAGPAGLTAALELLDKTDIKPVIYEESSQIGGISKTICYKGNRIDIGGHRFFSKSTRVMDWWTSILPIQGESGLDHDTLGREGILTKKESAPHPELTDRVMLVRNRLSRIFYLRSFFDYPVSLNWNTVKNLGFFRIIKIGLSYFFSQIFPVKPEVSLEDFFINRFGRELYLTFFKDYTEKVWGLPCDKISKEWGAQRIKGLSLTKTLIHAVKSIFKQKKSSISQKETETSLIEHFLYPKYGPGHLWEEAAKLIEERGGEIRFNRRAVGINGDSKNILSLSIENTENNSAETVKGDYLFSTMPVRDLIDAFYPAPPDEIKRISEGLMYRDFITVGLLLNRLKVNSGASHHIVPDNWIYIQERDVKVGRLQIFNNWSPYLVNDENTVWIGLEYFCNEGDALWCMSEEDMKAFAVKELEKIDMIDKEDVLDAVVIKVKKTYPAYFGSYGEFGKIRQFVDRYENLFLIGRNGMHRYNNMDHSMLTAMTAVENIVSGRMCKDNIWNVNTEEEYHEEK